MARFPNELGGLVMVYGVAPTPAVMRELTPEQIEQVKQTAEQLKANIDAAREPKTVEDAAKALADAVAAESAAADRHREALAKADDRYKSELGHVAKLAEKHIAARERVAAARAKVVELAKREP